MRVDQNTASLKLYQRVMRRMTPIFILTFALAGFFGIVLLQFAGTNLLQRTRLEAGEFTTNLIESEVDKFVTNLHDLEQSRAVRQYVLTLATVLNDNPGQAVRVAQSEILQKFDDAIKINRDRVLAMRYLHLDGNTWKRWGEAINTSGNVSLQTQQLEYTPLDASTFADATAITTPGGQLISGIIRSPDGIDRVSLYVPVFNLSQTIMVGMLEMELSITPFLNDFGVALKNSSYGGDSSREYAVFDRSGQMLYSNRPEVDPDAYNELLAEAKTDIVNRVNGLDVVSVLAIASEYQGETFPWYLVMKDSLIAPDNRYYGLMALLIIGAVLLCWFSLGFLERVLRSMLEPVDEARSLASRLANSIQDRAHTQTLNLTTLSLPVEEQTLTSMVTAIEEAARHIGKLRDRIEREDQRRRRDIEIAARIGRETTSRADLNHVLDQAIELICRELNYYHAQVFLTDDVGENAVLVRSRGEVGRQLIAQGHKIALGSKTVIGQVIEHGEPVIVNDTRNRGETPHGFNALLEDTSAELGLPLIIQSKVIGALDIQSRTPNAFNPEDMPTFRLLADQVALAVNTARLLNETRQQVHQVEALNRLYTRQSWEQGDQQGIRERAYRYNLMNVEPAPLDEPAADNGHGGMSLPISLRGEVIGVLSAASNDGQYFTEGDEVVLRAVADRVALAIENARLFQETQVNLAETSVLYRLSRFLNEATTLDDILQSIVVSVMQDADSAQVWVFEEYIDEPDWVYVAADIAYSEREEGSESLTGLRINVSDHPFVRRIRSNQVTLIHDTRNDIRLDAGLQLIFRRIHARTVVIIPLSVRGEWRGMIMVEYDEPREFSEREGRIFSALIDQAGVAIDNRLLLEQTESARSRSENLYAASRIINTMQTYKELVYAVLVTSTLPLDYRLTLLEGELDATGWPTRGRVVAESKNGTLYEVDRVQPIYIAPDAPLRNREPLIRRDDLAEIEDVPAEIRNLRNEGYRYQAVFPLFSANQPVALFSVLSTELVELSPDDYEVYRAITGQMSTQLENRRLLDRTEQALDETRRLYTASRAINSAQDSREVYITAIQHLARPFIQTDAADQVDISVILTRDINRWDAPLLDCVYAWSSNPEIEHGLQEGVTLTAEEFPVGRLMLETNGAMYIKNTGQLTGLMGEDEVNALLRNNKAGSVIIAPIQYRQRWFGVIVCQNTRPDAFNEQYTRFAEAIADQVALAVENRQLFEEAQTEARRAQEEAQRALALAEAGQLANQIGVNFEENLQEVFNRVATAAGYTRWAFNLINERTRQSESVAVSLPPEITAEISPEYAFTEGLLPMSLSEVGVIINDPATLPLPAVLDSPEQARRLMGKTVSTPVRTGDRVVGSLLIGREFDGDDMDAGDQELANTLASQLAVALDNRRLFRQAQTEQQTLRSTLETLPAGVLVLDPNTMRPTLENQRALEYLGDALRDRVEFNSENYHLYRTGTQLNYPNDELPVFVAMRGDGSSAFTDDVAVIYGDEQIDLLVNAAPIKDSKGGIEAIIVTLSDISNLRSLENTLQENLRETVAIYEAQRGLNETSGLDEVLDVLISQMAMLQPGDGYILLVDEYDGSLSVARHLVQPLEDPFIFSGLLEEEHPVQVGPSQLARLPTEQRKALLALDIQSVLSVPLSARTRDLPLGWLVVIQTEVEYFTPEQERILTQLGGIASTTIDNRYLIQSTRAALQETDSLYRANTAISRSRDLEQLVEALRIAFASMQPTMYAAFTTQGSLESTDLVVSDTGDPGLLRAALLRHPIPEPGIFINDLTLIPNPSPLERDLMAAAPEGIRAVGAVNLRVKDGSGGVLMVCYDQVHRFTDAEIRYMTAMTDSTSVVMDNLVLVQEIQSTLEETTILYQAGRSLTNATTPQDVLNVVVDFLIQPHIDQAFVALLKGRDWNSSSAVVEVDASWSQGDVVDLNGVTLASDQFPAWQLMATQSLLTISDIESDENLDPMVRAGIQSLDARSLVIIPLRVPNRAIGALWISSRQPYTHTEREARIYQAFGEQASLSMEAAYLVRQTERRARQLETSAEISTSAGNILDLQTLLPQIVDLIQGAFGYDHVQVFLMDDEDEYAWVRASTGDAGRQLLAVKHKLKKGSSSVIGQVTATGKPSIALDTADSSVVHMPNPHLPLTRSEMALPLTIKNRVIGALDVQSNQPNAFTDDDVNALVTLAAQISIAIENARLYEESQRQANRMSFLFEATTAAAAAETLDETIQNVADYVRDSFKALDVAMYLQRTYTDHNNNSYAVLEPVALSGTTQPLSELEVARLSDTNRLLSNAARDLRSQIIDDTYREESYLPVMPAARSVMLMPMLSGGELLGMLTVEDERPNRFTADDLQLMQALSSSVSAVIQSAQLLERLTNANDELRELDRLKSDFLANMSHELRTPLNSIIGFSRVMLKGIDGTLTEMQEQDLTTIYNSGQHLLGLINDILDQAKIAAGKMDLKLAYFDIRPVVEGVKSIGLGLIKDKPIQLYVEMAQTLPKAYGDEFRTRQVLLNLVSNASKFTSQGSVTIRVYPVNEDGKAFIRIEVIDSGIGIAEKDIPLLFEAFRQVDSSLTRTAGGTGLGLPIARSLVEMQGGKMYVDSVVNQGSTFSITIPTEPVPVEDVPEEPEVKPKPEDLKPSTQPTLDTRTIRPPGDARRITQRMMQIKRQILLIEDNPEMVDQFRRTTQREGFEVLAASIMLEAEAMASGLHPTLIIMDVNFAKGAGWELLKRLKDRDDTFDIPVIVVTLSDESERAYQLGAHTYIQRPFIPEDLVKAVLEAEKESNTERILIIDDQPEAIRLLKQLLDEHGKYRVFTAESGQEGISLVARRRPDLVILDLRMPDMDGFAVLNELRSNPETSAIPVMVVTGDVDLNKNEKDQLANISILMKGDISDEDYQSFIDRVKNHLSGEEGL